jgi:cytochrome c peroxidase|tara:strand:- start:25220 stop:26830 length:1611 start_codon:yes stop_codon:yes gene_type:complete
MNINKSTDSNLHRNQPFSLVAILVLSSILVACGGGSSNLAATPPAPALDPAPQPDPQPDPEPNPILEDIDLQLQAIILEQGLTGSPETGRNLPSINDPLPQLGKMLFFSKSLGGDMDAACASCHHPLLGGADELSLAVGVGALNPDLLGPGRADSDALPDVPRNSPTVFNIGLWDHGLFWDSKVESLNPTALVNGADGGISTPHTAFNVTDVNAGANLPSAQVRFPVISDAEMKGAVFESGSTGDAIRTKLTERIGGYGSGGGELATNTWTNEFQTALNSTQDATQLINFESIAFAIGEYERSMLFVNNPWFNYIQGDTDALSNQQKDGAVLFYSSADEGGGGCSNCHSGDLFSDELFHVVAFPQFGPGKGAGATGDGDFARESISGDRDDRFAFRTPSLLNIEVTPPYGHTGAYDSLDEVLNHYDNPNNNVGNFFDDEELCDLVQFQDVPDCVNLYPNGEANSEDALDELQAERRAGTSLFDNTNMNNQEERDVVAFLRALTDPCVLNDACLAPWIADTLSTGPDGNQLNADFSN